MVKKLVTLNSGDAIPVIGLGVYQTKMGFETYEAVKSALRLGYLHVDTAQVYRNEESVGKAIAEFLKQRNERVWITSKVWTSNWGYDSAKKSIAASLEKLQVRSIDLMLLHCPGEPKTRADTWRALEDAQTEGMVKNIGVSNFGIPHLEKLQQTARVTPAVNQIEVTPFLQRRALVEYCKTNGIAVEAYSPLTKGQKLRHPTLVDIASRNDVSVPQVLIRWSLQMGFIPLPKSTKALRQQENMAVFDFELSEEDMNLLDGLEDGYVTGWDPITQDPV